MSYIEMYLDHVLLSFVYKNKDSLSHILNYEVSLLQGIKLINQVERVVGMGILKQYNIND